MIMDKYEDDLNEFVNKKSNENVEILKKFKINIDNSRKTNLTN
jgi:hypothetical protein